MAPFISIITITRNNLVNLEKTVDSVQRQTTVDYEHLVIDGGSTDGTADWLGHRSLTNPRMQYVSAPDNGIYDAMNKGLALATGKFVVYLNAGDYLPDEVTLAGVRCSLLDTLDGGWLIGGAVVVDESGLVVRPFPSRKFRRWPHLLSLQNVCHQAVYMDRLALNGIGGFTEQYGSIGDFVAISQMAERIAPHQTTDKLVCYLAGGISERQYAPAFWEAHAYRSRGSSPIQRRIDWLWTLGRIGALRTRMGLKRRATTICPGMVDKWNHR